MNNKHDHHWHGCEHKNLAFCKHCKVPYCKDCNKEWAERYTFYPQYYNSNTVEFLKGIQAQNTNTLNDGHTTLCTHTEAK